MRLLREMETIQIDITNACIHECSNCTRLCGNHNKPFFMDFETFKKAVDSLDGFEGAVGIMGGEPVIHPEFDQFVAYAGSRISHGIVKDSFFYAPKKDYMETVWSYSYLMKQLKKAHGLSIFSSIPKQYYKHYELIAEYFTFYRMNDHSNPCYHQPIMVSYQDLGISDDEFIKLRDNCWLQSKWSATITPKGAFFCEIAGALDILFDGPGGWKVEPGWWKREIRDYQDQLHWCELCGICLDTTTRDANEEIDDVSETLHHMLEKIDSPKLKKGKISIYSKNEIRDQKKEHLDGNYLLDYTKRIGTSRQNLLPKNMQIVLAEDLEKITEQNNLVLYDWIVVPEEQDSKALKEIIKKLQNMFLNPGILYQIDIKGCQAKIFHANASTIHRLIKNYDSHPKKIDWRTELKQCYGEKQYTIREGFEDEPDVDYAFYENHILAAYRDDGDFIAELENRLSAIEKAQPILLPMVSHPYNVRAFARLLREMGYHVHIMASKQHECDLQGIVPEGNLHFFDHHRFDYQQLEKFADNIKDQYSFAGAILPTSATADHLIGWDGYDDAIQLMERMGVPIIGIINAKRRFCRL